MIYRDKTVDFRKKSQEGFFVENLLPFNNNQAIFTLSDLLAEILAKN